jgi:lipoprotein-releasing system ATP-binding protein
MNDAPPKAESGPKPTPESSVRPTSESGAKPTPESGGEDPPILFLHGVDRHYHQGDVTLEILKGAELAVWPGQSVALVAPSGAGKSTLLHIAGLLEQADAGEVYIDQVATSGLSDAERTRIRRIEIGFVYQFHHLLMEFSAIENVIMPQMIRGLSRDEASRRATDLLNYLGLKERFTHRPAELSGGEQQRVAIARAVANAPRILLADEPTGNLDPRTSDHVFSALTQLVRASGLAVVVATHNMDIAGRMDRRVTLREGQVVELE